MKPLFTIALIGILFLSPTSAIFNFFKFGSGSEGSSEAASSNSATLLLPNSPTSSEAPSSPSGYSYLFGTGVTGTQSSNHASDSSSPSMGGGLLSNGGTVQSMGGGAVPPASSAGAWNQDTANSGGNFGGTRTPSLPPTAPNHHHFSASPQTKGQNHHNPSTSLPQSHSSGMPLHSSNIPPHLATNPSSMSNFNSWNTKPNINTQQHSGHGFASHHIQTSNGIRFNEETQTQGTRFRPNSNGNDGFGNSGKTTTKQGSFSWTSPEGQLYEVKYVADAMGYRPSGSHLPQQPVRQETFSSPPLPYSYSQFKPVSHYP